MFEILWMRNHLKFDDMFKILQWKRMKIQIALGRSSKVEVMSTIL